MTSLYREFQIDERTLGSILVAIRAFWQHAVVPFVKEGRRVLLIFTSEEAKRNNQQNARLWRHVYTTISEQAWVNGRQFDKDTWHEYLARKFGVMEEMTLPDGEIIQRRKSTTEYGVGEFSDYMRNCEIYAAQELGVVWPA